MTLTVFASQIHNQSGIHMASNSTTNFHRYFGDSNGDEHVDIVDFGLFTTTYGLNSSQTGLLSYFDFNNDSVIYILDFGQFSIRMFTVLP